MGSVFEVPIGDGRSRCFQAVAVDATQLDSCVIRVFRETHGVGAPFEMTRITTGEPDFHAHVFLNLGIKLGFWRKVGYVWKVNEPTTFVGELSADYQDAEIGVVVRPVDVLHRIRHGQYDFAYPAY